MTQNMTRRNAFRVLGVGAATVVLGGVGGSRAFPAPADNAFESPLLFHSPKMVPFQDALPTLPTVSGSSLSVDAVSAAHRFHTDLPNVPTLAYHCGPTAQPGYLGPIIEGHADEPLTLRFSNRMGIHPIAQDMDTSLHGVTEGFRTATPMSLHLHGGVTPPESDGNPEQLTRPGESIVHHFPNGQEAATLWYHDHAMGITRVNVYAGLAGMYLLRDRFDTGLADNLLGLPSGEFEMPLVMQEKIFREDGHLSIRSTRIVPEGSWEGGAVGDVGLVNGVVWPELTVARGLYRFRIINAASYSVWSLHFENHMRFWVIGNDGGLLDAPVPVTSIRMAPGERYDLLVDFSGYDAGATVELRNDEAPPFQAAVIGAVTMPLLCRFRVGSARGFTGGVPTSLRGGAGPAPIEPIRLPTRVRTVTVSQPYALRNPPAIMSLNNLRYSDPDIEMPRPGTVEQWNIVNITPDPHPIHIHLVTFRILSRTPLRTVDYQVANPQPAIGIKWTPDPEGFLAGPAFPPAPWEAGWKDTVRVDGGTVTRIIVRFPTADELGFDPDATFARPADTSASEPSAEHGPMHDVHNGMDHSAGDLQGYVWHCHLLDHEDHDMMLKYRIVQ
ncbi:multicopper oxidase domain-containing protein [Rhodococcus sp. IEGM 1381]|uniref:multicopper oxidase family protein n=1 Tax=Rhodococcus sp. IEGM 1381 TaxID=3047085 RepID=UPI0024B6548C|nr:multicopper oxidase domain-containing protein [Rhodococcus sp. IEGM 1381]MDI9896867.1 multicopper oxidase domain-containing protein [Rhodococcus sp. IEGM 1381]